MDFISITFTPYSKDHIMTGISIKFKPMSYDELIEAGKQADAKGYRFDPDDPFAWKPQQSEIYGKCIITDIDVFKTDRQMRTGKYRLDE